MANVLKTGSDWLLLQLRSKVGVAVTLKRGGVSAAVTATVGSSRHEQETEFGGIVQWESRDYLIAASDYAFSGVSAEPQRGDRIEHAQDGTTRTFEVMGDGAAPAWRWSDDYHNTYRVHVKEVWED